MIRNLLHKYHSNNWAGIQLTFGTRFQTGLIAFVTYVISHLTLFPDRSTIRLHSFWDCTFRFDTVSERRTVNASFRNLNLILFQGDFPCPIIYFAGTLPSLTLTFMN